MNFANNIFIFFLRDHTDYVYYQLVQVLDGNHSNPLQFNVRSSVYIHKLMRKESYQSSRICYFRRSLALPA